MTHRGPFQALPFCDSVTLKNFWQGATLRARFFRGLVFGMLSPSPSLLVRISLAPCRVVSWGGDIKRLESFLGGTHFGSCLGNVPVGDLIDGLCACAPRKRLRVLPAPRDGCVLAPPAAAFPLGLW